MRGQGIGASQTIESWLLAVLAGTEIQVKPAEVRAYMRSPEFRRTRCKALAYPMLFTLGYPWLVVPGFFAVVVVLAMGISR